MHRLIKVRAAVVVCVAIAWSAVALAQQPKPQAARAELQGFSMVLLVGDLQSGPTTEGVSPAARKALADMKDFLPYKSYRVADTVWILASNGRNATARVRGQDNQEYELFISGMNAPPSDLRVLFRLSEGGDYPAPSGSIDTAARATQVEVRKAQLADLEARRKALEQEHAALREKYSSNPPQVSKNGAEQEQIARQIQVVKAEIASSGFARKIIDTTFSMDVGETVVVGTSRLGGRDKALIALLTAVPRTK